MHLHDYTTKLLSRVRVRVRVGVRVRVRVTLRELDCMLPVHSVGRAFSNYVNFGKSDRHLPLRQQKRLFMRPSDHIICSIISSLKLTKTRADTAK